MFSLLGTASTMGLHMVSGPIVGAVLGWLIDRWLDSWPVGAAVGLFLGIIAGFRNVWADARFLIREQEHPSNEALSSTSSPDTPDTSAKHSARNTPPGGGQAE